MFRIGTVSRMACHARSYSVSAEKRLQRSLLYVPSSNDRMLQKSLVSPSDALIYDLEDSVAPNEKPRARTALLGFLQKQPVEHSERTFVRLNALDTPQFVEDITTLLQYQHLQGIVMPKIHSAEHLDKVASYVPQGRPLNIIASIESARGLWDAGRIAGWGKGPESRPQGAGDKVAVSSLLTVRIRPLFAPDPAKSYFIPDHKWRPRPRRLESNALTWQVCVNYQDETILREECEEARRLGYDGKQAIHPNQVAVIQETFVPTEKALDRTCVGLGVIPKAYIDVAATELLRAAKIVAQMERSHASSTGAFGLADGDGGNVEMIDAPMLKQAEATIAKAKAAGLKVPDV